MIKDSKEPVWFLGTFLLMLMLILCCKTPTLLLAAEGIGNQNAHVEFVGNKELFSLALDTDTNEIVFKADYNYTSALYSYHTTGWYVTTEETNNATGGYYIDVSPNQSSTHDYIYDNGLSKDTNRFSYEDIKGMMQQLFPEDEDLTEPHTIYLHDVYIKKYRKDADSPWEYDWGGSTYSTLDEFMTMYPSYDGNSQKRDEMSHYYNIPLTISLSAVNVTVHFVDTDGNKLKDSETVRVYVNDNLTYPVPEQIETDNGTFGYKDYATDYANAGVEGYTLTIKKVMEDGEVELIYGKDSLNVTVKYVDEDGVSIKNDMTMLAEKGQSLTIPIEETINSGAYTYTYKTFTSTEEGGVESGNAIVYNKVENTMTVTLIYKKGPLDETEDGDEISGTATGPIASLVIKSVARGNEEFDVGQGIPTTEAIYANGITSEYLLDYSFKKMKGEFTYTIAVSRTYRFETDDDVYSQTVTKYYTVTRPYSYWKVERFNVYVPSLMTAKNTALPGGMVALVPYGLSKPLTVLSKPNTNVIEPVHHDVTLRTVTYYNSYTIPDEGDWSMYAEAAVGSVRVMNDYLSFGGVVYMSNSVGYGTTSRPSEVEVVGPAVDENVFFKTNMLIPYNIKNAVYDTDAKVTYQQHYSYGAGVNLAKDYPINSTNSVTVHTPVVCYPSVSGADMYVQSTEPGAGVNLVLDGYFTVDLSTSGQHLDIKGYGNRDYMEYTFDRQVSFPFGVYDGATYVAPNTWYDVSGPTSFYVPTWVKEGNYEISFRCVAVNADLGALDSLGQRNANKMRSKYVATDSVSVKVTGRVYGFQVYDITDYPTWESVFRKPNSLKLSGNTYRAGLNNRNGVLSYPDSVFTLPILSGSHPTIRNKTVGTGYMFRYYLYTIGTTYDVGDFIWITPTFYYVSKDGSNRQEVDVYYNETINGKVMQLVKVGGSIDRQNVKSVSLGNDYTAVGESELRNTANALGTTVAKLKGAKVNSYTFSQINLLSGMRTFVGSQANIPASVGTTASLKSVQKWYGEFYLPSEIHVTQKGFNLEAYSSNGSLDFTEDFWLGEDGGYLVVNFDIAVYNDGRKVLTYKDGNCNMWQMEGYKNSKTDYYQKTFSLKDGDIIFYDLSQSARKDYRPGGTH